MAEERCNLQGISWTETFPFVRLFATFKRAISFWPLVLAFAAVLLTYICGRVLDAIWIRADAGVLVVAAPGERAAPSGGAGGREALAGLGQGGIQNEITAYATRSRQEFVAWKQLAETEWRRVRDEAQKAEREVSDEQRAELLALIAGRVAKGLARVDAETGLDAEQKEQRRSELQQAADVLRLTLAGRDVRRLGLQRMQAQAVETVIEADPDVPRQQRAEDQARLNGVLSQVQKQAECARRSPRGPFIALLDYEMDCFAGAVQGVLHGRWGFSGSGAGSEPALLGSIAAAGSGILWLITQRPLYFVILAVVCLAIYSFAGGAICRIAAVRSARDESLSIKAALKFTCQKFTGLAGAPLFPIGIGVVTAVLMFLGGLFSALPYVGEVFAGLFYWLALIGGFVLALAVLVVVLGLHLMWPTIAVEASDAFDAISRAANYVAQRAWHTAFYSFVLLLYGGVCFVMVRVIALLMLKLTHFVSGLGINLASSAETSAIGKLDAMWHMPAWQDLPLLPATGDVNFWGSFATAPLSGTETFGMFFIALWVFAVVGLVGAFVVSFYFCGSTEMYFLLRKSYDAVDYDEIYYEEPEEEKPAEAAEAASEAREAEKPAGEPAAAAEGAPPETPESAPPQTPGPGAEEAGTGGA